MENLLDEDSYTQEYLGLFHAQHAGVYTFYLSSDDQSSVSLSNAIVDFTAALPDSTAMTEVVKIDGWTNFRYLYRYTTG